MGTNYYAVKKKPTIAEPLHIGKSSCGWKFLFHEVNKYTCEFDNEKQLTENNKEDLTYCKNVNGYRFSDRDFS